MSEQKSTYIYETHLHTSPVSKCGRCSVRDNLLFYKRMGYAGVFITNHFLDGNFGGDRSLSYEEQIEFYFSEVDEAKRLGEEIGIDVFYGVESSYLGTDFLIYGLGKDFFLAHPELLTQKRSDFLLALREAGAFVAQAHPYREASYIDHIRLFPRQIEAVEVINSSNPEPFMNDLARIYAETYGLLQMAGSDNHFAESYRYDFGATAFSHRLQNVEDFIASMRSGEGKVVVIPNPNKQ